MNASPLMHDHLQADTLLAGFQRCARRHPGAPAVLTSEASLTYGELDLKVNQLVARLRRLGIGSGDLVGVGISRSCELVVALLAVAKSGAAYVPLDPAYPRERLAHMISSIGLRSVLTRANLAAVFSNAGASSVIEIDETGINTSSEVLPHSDPLAPLYAIYTSGSTGLPKAASVYRKGFSNLLDWYVDELDLGPCDATLVISSPSFDLTQKNLFAPLLTGGRLVLDDGSIYDISRITSLVRDHGITVINCTPSAFYPLVEAAAATGYSALSSLRHVVLGGEPVSIPRLRPWLEHPACRAEVLNTYGPTECTDICAYHRLTAGNLDAFDFVPLGREIPNVTVTIRDEDLAEAPDGTPGELCISGAGLGGGYLNDPERTAAAFALAGALYRTGDLARRLPCGRLEFRGRLDHQVKVKGFRIEPGEIEIALSKHEGVKEAVVTARDNTLTAHIQGFAPIAELKEFLAGKLPSYMLPGEFVFVDDFPLTPNGKIDRKALAGHPAPREQPASAAPADELESRILGLWSEVLKRPVDDPTANFFDLGGTSIHLAVVHVRLNEMTGRDFAITDLFARPSARALALLISPPPVSGAAAPTHDRARLQQAGFARFRRPPTR
ncbi:non-ribosomal peptide synthetase [Luteolibacter marinus]|uniref:non-ribosomal peptide synthetase n=1 Tax=Luteolibacter marinus TaxID=2776705 RepID=UPI0018676F9E|nr:non-ribosomal peptide synthetase [Luteolibacter marinus]